jgi:hypothetical protein
MPIADLLRERLALRYARSSAAKKKSKWATQSKLKCRERERERKRSRTQQIRCRRLMRTYYMVQELGAQIARIEQSAALAF